MNWICRKTNYYTKIKASSFVFFSSLVVFSPFLITRHLDFQSPWITKNLIEKRKSPQRKKKQWYKHINIWILQIFDFFFAKKTRLVLLLALNLLELNMRFSANKLFFSSNITSKLAINFNFSVSNLFQSRFKIKNSEIEKNW